MHDFIINKSHLPKMTPEGRSALLVVEKYTRALLRADTREQLAILSDVVTMDYSGRHGYGKIVLPKADAINFHKVLRSQIEVIDYTIVIASGDAGTVFVLGDTTEKVRDSGIVSKENYVWIYTLDAGVIAKIEYSKETHPLFDFFSSISESRL